MGAGMIVSESQPEMVNRYTWCKPLANGSVEYYELSDSGWNKVYTLPAPAALDHTHTGLDDLPDIITLLSNGITGSKTLGGYTFTFNHGVLVGFAPA